MHLVKSQSTIANPEGNAICESSLTSPAAIFERQDQCLTMIKLLAQLTKAVQQHRGATMSVLSGESSFLALAESTHRRIETILSVLRLGQFEETFNTAQDSLQSIEERWQLIAEGWVHDHLLHNFEFHSHLVDALIKLIRYGLSEEFVLFGDIQKNSLFAALDSALIQTLDNAELLAILRGMSTNAAVLKTCGIESRSRISYLLKEVPRRHKALQYTLNKLKEESCDLSITEEMAQHNKKLNKYLLSIQITILDNPDISSDSSKLFSISTEFVDLHWSVFEQLIMQLEKRMYIQLLS